MFVKTQTEQRGHRSDLKRIPGTEIKLKDKVKTNLNAYLFANLAIVGVLLIGLWNRKPVWDVSLRFPNLLLMLVLINTVLLFRDVILGAATSPGKARRKRARRRARNLNDLRAVLHGAEQIDESLLNKALTRLQKISGSETVTLYVIEGNQSRQLAAAGEIPPALTGSRFSLKGEALHIKFSGNLGDEEIGKITADARPVSFKSAVSRLEMTALPLHLPAGKTGLCIFSSREGHNSPPVSLPSTALFLETLLALIESSKNAGDARYKDKNTGLFLFACFNDSFETEVERSERYKQEMSLLTIGIKGYNGLNDSEKQTVNNNAALALKQSLRRLDLMFCGQNDGQFLAILTETGVQVAAIVAQRIQKTFAKLNEKFDFISKHDLAMIIGSATYPTDATHGQGLLEKSNDSCHEAENIATCFKAYNGAGKD